jgi:sigma-B regulation protein RsbU (phosphoserine phosphatase)
VAARLRDVEALADAALSRLDEQALLATLVERVKNVLQADTAAVLLFDPSASQLVAAAASGIEDEVRQGVRIPLGTGFAGRVAATREPVILTEVNHATVRTRCWWSAASRPCSACPCSPGARSSGCCTSAR